MIIISDNIQFVNENIVLNVSGASLSGTNNTYEWYLYSNQVGYHSSEIDISNSATSQTIQYANIGNYYPAVRSVRSGVGELNSYYQVSNPIVINPIPKLRYEGTTLVNDVMTFYDLRATSYGVGSISATSINFGDGVILTSAGTSGVFSHSYPVAGNYSVTLIVTDNSGNSSTYVEIVEILDEIGHGSTSADYIRLLGPDTHRHTQNRLINLRQYLPSSLVETPTEQYLEVFENFLNEMYDGANGITSEENQNNSNTYPIGSTYTLPLVILDVDYINIGISRDGGLTYSSFVTSAEITHYTSGDQEIYEPYDFSWVVTGPETNNCIIKVTASYDESIYYFQNIQISNINSYYNSLDFVLPDDTMKISILEKINRLSELQDPELIDLEYIQFFAKNLGYSIDISRNDIAGDAFGNLGVLDNTATNLADQRKYLRFVIQNLPNWYKIKTTKNCVSIMLYSFGLIGDLVEMYTKDYSNNKLNWNMNDVAHLDNSWYPTSHFTIMIDIDNSVNIVNDINNKNSVIAAIESVKPINTVFENLSGKMMRYAKLYVQGLTRISKHIRIEDTQFSSDYWY